ncbi:MAG: ComEC/Rec2 family competence protein [Microbacterium arborescens]
MNRSARRRDLRLVPAAALTWLAAGIATHHPAAAPWVLAGFWLCAGVGLVVLPVLVRGGRTARTGAIVALAFGCAVAAAAATQVAVAQPARDRAMDLPISGGRATVVELVVTGKVERTTAGWRFDALTTSIRAGDAETAASVPVSVRSAERPDGLDIGSRASVTGSGFPARAGARAVLVIDATAPPLVRSPPSGALAVASSLRTGLLAQTATLPQPAAGLIAGLAVGDTSAVSEQLEAEMQLASLSHLTAVSGANCALVVGIAFGAAAAVGMGRRWRVTAGLAALVGFVVLVSPEPSVVRAAAMAAIAMLAMLLGRAGAGVAVLCLAVCACLVADPWLAGSIGFALSAAATGALLLAAGPLGDTLGRWMPRPLALSIAVPLAAQLACTPLIVLIEPQLPVYAVLANALTAPAAPFATVAGLAACIAAGVPLVGAGLAALAWLPCAWIAATAAWVATLPAPALPWLPDVGGALLALVLSAAVTVVLWPGAPRVAVRSSAVALAILGGAIGGQAVSAGPLERARVPSGWAIAQCDVGQGDAVLLRSDDQVALVDTGADPELLSACLDLFGITRLDLLVLTHFDLDHSGGATAVVGRAGLVLHGPMSDPAEVELLHELREGGAEVRAATSGMTGILGGAVWEVLWPRARGAVFPPGNDASVVMSVRGGGIPSALLLGDLSETPQTTLAGAVRERFDVVKVAHHGSADQSRSLYARIGARAALIGVGENTYGHPRDETLAMLTGLGAVTVRSDLSGATALSLRGEELILWRQRGGESPPPAGVSGQD